MPRIRAAVARAFGAPLAIEEVDLRAPQGREIEVTLEAVAICHSDITYLEGAWGGPLPAVYGHEAAGGALQAASRTMMVHQANPARMTEAFGLYALAGKATSFLAPLSIGIVTAATGSQQLGILPLIVLFIAGLVLLAWVKPDGDRAGA